MTTSITLTHLYYIPYTETHQEFIDIIMKFTCLHEIKDNSLGSTRAQQGTRIIVVEQCNFNIKLFISIINQMNSPNSYHAKIIQKVSIQNPLRFHDF